MAKTAQVKVCDLYFSLDRSRLNDRISALFKPGLSLVDELVWCFRHAHQHAILAVQRANCVEESTRVVTTTVIRSL